jgi:hypothetical protein
MGRLQSRPCTGARKRSAPRPSGLPGRSAVASVNLGGSESPQRQLMTLDTMTRGPAAADALKPPALVPPACASAAIRGRTCSPQSLLS